LFAQLVSKIFNLCGHDPPTSQTDGQTDRQTTCDRKTALCTMPTLYTYTLWQNLGVNWHRGWKVKGQSHTVMKTVTIARLLVNCAAAAVCCSCWRRATARRYDFSGF